MRCLILAAGYATRLYPLTENFPKPLLKVRDKAILDWLLEDMQNSAGIEEYIVISNHKFASVFERWAQEKRLQGYPVRVLDDGTSSNETRLGAVKDVQFTVETLGLSGDLLVLAGDNLLDFSLCRFIDYAKQKGKSCIMRYYEADDARLKKSGVVSVDENDLVLEMTEKSPTPATHWCCPAFYYYTAEDAKRIPDAIADGCGTDAPGSFIAWLCRHSPVYAMEMPGARYDIGDIKSYEAVQENYKGYL